MAHLRVPKTSPIVKGICKKAGVTLKKFKKPEEFEKEVVKYIEKNDIVHLATSRGDTPRSTPLGYRNIGTTLYIFSEGGGKFANLKENEKVCYSIASRVRGGRNLFSVQGLQCWGKARVFSMRENPEEFEKHLRLWKLEQQLKKEGVKALSPKTHYRIIKIEPYRMRMLNLSEGINNITWTKK